MVLYGRQWIVKELAGVLPVFNRRRLSGNYFGWNASANLMVSCATGGFPSARFSAPSVERLDVSDSHGHEGCHELVQHTK
jgi:hypothetical protein